MQITPNWERKVTKVTIVLEGEEECKNFEYILSRACVYPFIDTIHDDRPTKLANELYNQIYKP